MQPHKTIEYMRARYWGIVILTIIISFSSCIFDKELKQDTHIASFRQEMSKVTDSIVSSGDRIIAYHTILDRIENDKDLITQRKKNMVLIECHFYISNEYYDLGEYEKAIDQCDLAILLDTTNATSFYNRGVAYQAKEEYENALQDYGKTLALSSDYADAYYNRAIIYESMKDYQKALEDFDNTLKLKPKYLADIYLNRGKVHYELGDVKKALADLDQSIVLDPVNIEAYSYRAYVYKEEEDYENALFNYSQALSVDSCNISIYNKRAITYELNKEYDNAIFDYNKIIELDYYTKTGMGNRAKDMIKKLSKEKHTIK